jgi:hypothetical protein
VDSEHSVSREYFENAVEKAKAIAAHTYIYVGNNDVSVDKVAEVVKRHYAATGRKPVVILDYLQILNPNKDAVNNRYDVRRSTNDDITKRYSDSIYYKYKAIGNEIPLGFTQNTITGERRIKMDAIIKPAREKGLELVQKEIPKINDNKL